MSVFSKVFARSRVPAPLPYPAGSPEGLAARWIQWVAGIPRTHNPVADLTGADAGVNQPADVWFLAGTFGRQDVERRCAVPAGSPLFLPAFNMWHRDAAGPPPRLPRAFGTLIVDDSPVGLDTIATPVPFEVVGARFNPVTAGRKPVAMTVWGLWRRLDPLSTGQHTVRIFGGDGHGFTVGVTYQLSVA